MVGGTSAGALIAALYAMEWNADDIFRAATERLFSRRAILDFTMPMVSLAAAHGINKAYREIFQDLRIEDLRLPFFCVSSNLTRAQMMVHQSGLLRRYVRASTSLPVIYPPVADENGDLLVDGALFNNLPVSIMHSLLDGGTVIAVDVGGSEPIASQSYNYDDSLSGWKVLRSRLDRSQQQVNAPDIMSILTRTIVVGSASVHERETQRANLLLRPPVDAYGLFDIEALPQMAEAGYDYGLNTLREWLTAQEALH
jgi:predicted acylesterase/phospholipase RssA